MVLVSLKKGYQDFHPTIFSILCPSSRLVCAEYETTMPAMFVTTLLTMPARNETAMPHRPAVQTGNTSQKSEESGECDDAYEEDEYNPTSTFSNQL